MSSRVSGCFCGADFEDVLGRPVPFKKLSESSGELPESSEELPEASGELPEASGELQESAEEPPESFGELLETADELFEEVLCVWKGFLTQPAEAFFKADTQRC